MKEYIAKVAEGENLTEEEAKKAMDIMLSGDATQAQIAAASNFAYNLGIAFQIKDDILDITGTSEMLGKPVGSDSDQGKVTYATKVGLEKAQQDVELLTDKALESLRAFDDTDFLQALAQSLISRDH